VFISVKELELKKVHFDVAFPAGEIDFQDDGDRLSQATPLQAEGSAEFLPHTAGEIRVRGHLAVTMRCDCNRCLEPAQFPIDSSFDLYYRPAEEAAGPPDAEVEIDEGEAEMGFYEGLGIELKDILHEQVLLSMPMQRVCRADCQGICPVCGQNRNLIHCGCEAKLVDDRWSALKKLQLKESTN